MFISNFIHINLFNFRDKWGNMTACGNRTSSFPQPMNIAIGAVLHQECNTFSDCGGCDRTSTLICDYFEVVTRKYHNASELKIDFVMTFTGADKILQGVLENITLCSLTFSLGMLAAPFFYM
jgi:hypothetical protein